MSQSTFQIPLNLYPKISMNGEDFYVSPAHEACVQFLKNWGDFPYHTHPDFVVLIEGPQSAGKTHLARIWQTKTKARLIDLKSDPLPESEIAQFNAPLIIDNLDLIKSNKKAQEVLFHLYNRALSEKLPLLLLSKEAPAKWKKLLPDLLTRLNSCRHLSITPPDDTLLQVLIMKHFADRQLFVGPEIISYLPKMIERSFEAVQKLIEEIDQTALSTKRKITLPLVREVLARLESAQPSTHPSSRKSSRSVTFDSK